MPKPEAAPLKRQMAQNKAETGKQNAMTQDDANIIVDFTNRVLQSCRLDLKAEAEEGEGGLRVQVRGRDIPILLAHNAELLDALEYLGGRVLTRARDEETHVVFDSGGYRARREKELRMMAEIAAEKVRVSKVPFAFDPMSAGERRVIHLALSDNPAIRTESSGSGDNRKIVVYPA